jgi:hypothetical protein
MARDHARLFIRIWSDDEFTAMTESAQRAYMMLVSQAGVNWAGVLDFRPRRWTQLAADTTTESLDKALRELAAARFIAIDEDHEEVLVRSYMRNDEVYKQPNLLKNALAAVRHVQSRTLRDMLAEELWKLVPLIPAARRDSTTNQEGVAGVAAALSKKGSGNPSANPSGNPKTEPLGEPFEEGPGVGEGEGVGVGTSSVVTSLAAKKPQRRSRKGDQRTPEHPLPADWQPNAAHRERASKLSLDVELQADLFRAHAEREERVARNWNGAFTTWLIKTREFEQKPSGRQPKLDHAAAKAWLLDEYNAGRVMPIQQRTGMRFPEPDLPLHISGAKASEEFIVGKAREWIKANHEELIQRLIARAA